jgi:hypothetical protein
MRDKMEGKNTKKVFIWLVICVLVIQIIPVSIMGDTWTQTTQEDFEGGTTIDTNATLSPGNVTLDLNSDWWDENWKYRIPINITENSGGDLTGFQVPVEIDTKALIDAGKMRSDLGDIRFIDPSGQELPHWIEVLDNLSYDEPNGPIAYWNFDEGDGNTTFDLSGNGNHGTHYGNTVLLMHFDEGSGQMTNDESPYENHGQLGVIDGIDTYDPNWNISGISGHCLEFNGTEDYVESIVSPSMDITEAITLEAWINPDVVSGGDFDVVVKGVSAYFELNPDGFNIDKMGFWHAGTLTWYFASTSIPVNEWTHVAVTWEKNSGNVSFYYNGQPDGSYSGITSSLFSDTNPFVIGKQWATNTRFFDGLIDEVAVYSKALSAEEIENHFNNHKASFTDWVDGKFNSGLEFDGVDDYIRVPDSNDFTFPGDFTIDLWIYIKNPTDNYVGILSTYTGVGQEGYMLAGYITSGNIGWWDQVIGQSEGWQDTGTSFSINQWQHLTVVRDAGAITFYKNGVQIYSFPCSGTFNGGALTFGKWDPAYGYLNGFLDEVRIYDRALSAEEIRAIYHEKSRIWVNVSCLSASQLTTIYMYYGNPLAISKSNFDATFTKDYGEDGLVGLWHMDEGSGLMTNDSSGNGNHGTLVNGPIWENEDGGQWNGRSEMIFANGSALEFDGIDDYVEIPDDQSLDITQGGTIEGWFKLNSLPTIQVYNIICKGTSPVDRWRIDITTGGEKLKFITGGGIQVEHTAHFSTQIYYYFVVTWDGVNTTMYLNGKNVANSSSGSFSNPSVNIYISSEAGVKDYFNGTIDEVRIYNRSLSEDEIKAHYQRRKYANPEPTVLLGPEEMYQKYIPFGTYISTVFDSGGNATIWDIIEWGELLPPGTIITLATRSGDSSNPDDGTWSSWSSEISNSSGRSIYSPRSRYIQYRASLTTANRSVTPSLLEINIYYETNSVDPPTLSSPANGNWTSNPRPTFTWIFNDPNLDNQNGFTIEIDDDQNYSVGVYRITETNSSSEGWAALFSIPDGTYFWHVRTKDEYGLWSDWSENWSINIDRTAPDPPIDALVIPNTWTNINSFIIDWINPEDFSGVKEGCWYKIGTPPTSNSDGIWQGNETFTSTSSDGIHTIYFWLEDNVGNEDYQNYAEITFYLDMNPPAIDHIPITSGTEYQAINLTAMIVDNIEIKNATLFYRKFGETEFIELLMNNVGSNYYGEIPSSYVTTGELEYYISANDNVNAATNPTSAPAMYYSILIPDPPPTIIHENVTEADENQEINISATITDNIGVSGATLKYRIKGDSDWISITMKQIGDSFYAIIPDDKVTATGLEYYIVTTDGFSNVTFPGENPEGDPVEIKVTVEPDDEEPNEFEEFMTSFWWLLLLLFIVVVILVFLLSRKRDQEEVGIGAIAEEEPMAVEHEEAIPGEVSEIESQPEIEEPTDLPEEGSEPTEDREELGTIPQPKSAPPLADSIMSDDEIFESIKKKYEEGKISQETFEEIEKRYKKK